MPPGRRSPRAVPASTRVKRRIVRRSRLGGIGGFTAIRANLEFDPDGARGRRLQPLRGSRTKSRALSYRQWGPPPATPASRNHPAYPPPDADRVGHPPEARLNRSGTRVNPFRCLLADRERDSEAEACYEALRAIVMCIDSPAGVPSVRSAFESFAVDISMYIMPSMWPFGFPSLVESETMCSFAAPSVTSTNVRVPLD